MNDKLVIGLRLLAGLLAIGALAGAMAFGYQRITNAPIDRVDFAGDTARVPAAELDRLAAGVRGQPAAAGQLVEIRDAAKKMPWVRDAFVRRRFPAALEITIEAHDALARWDEGHLVSSRGDVFTGTTREALPAFTGPEGTGAEMVRTWAVVAPALGPLKSAPVELRLSDRRAWQVRLASGLVLELGRQDFAERIARFAEAWPQVADASPRYADLRYANGFALRQDPPADRRRPATKKT